MLNYNEIKERKYIVMDNEPYEVISAQVSRKQANKPVNKTKLKSLLSGKVIDYTFHISDKVDEAEISRRNIVYIYSKGTEHWFHSEGNKADRFTLDTSIVEKALDYISTNDTIDTLVYTDNEDEDQIIGFKLPIKMELKVTEAPPSIKGNTATGGNKLVTVTTGAKFTVPLFINVGDIIAVNTENGTYTERVLKT